MKIVIAAHPTRSMMAEDLARQVGGQIVWDQGRGEWDTHRRALLVGAASVPEDSHVIVLQDDALPVPDFPEHARDAIEVHPNALISFYVGTGRPRQPLVRKAITEADDHECAWLSCNSLLWGVGIAVPARYVAGIVQYRSNLPYDQRLGAWSRRFQVPVVYTWPSLVDHLDTVGLVRHRKPAVKRIAHRTGVPKRWATPVIEF